MTSKESIRSDIKIKILVVKLEKTRRIEGIQPVSSAHLNSCIIQKLPSFILPRGISNPRCPPPNEHDRLMTRFLEMSQDHDLQQTPDV